MGLDDILADLGIVFVVTVLAIYGIGYVLKPDHISKTRAIINKSPHVLFDYLLDFPKWPRWNKEVPKPERKMDQNGHMVWELGDHLVEIVEINKPMGPNPGHFIMRIANPKHPFQGTWTWVFEQEGGASKVTIIEQGKVASPLWRFLAKFLFGHNATAKTYLHMLGQHYEQGQDFKTEELPVD